MSISSLPPDDRPDPNDSELDKLWRRQLEASLSKQFYESCQGVTQSLLTLGEWHISNAASGLLLVIVCSDQSTYWRILNNIAHLGTHLAAFSQSAKIQIYPPVGMGESHMLQVDEIQTAKNSLPHE